MGRRRGGSQSSKRGYRGDMDLSQGSVERKAHGARMPTDPLTPSALEKAGEENSKGTHFVNQKEMSDKHTNTYIKGRTACDEPTMVR